MTDWIDIDGSQGEGGGQVLRTSLALAAVTGRAFRIRRIRANRAKPGLWRQHLTAVKAAAHISQARVTGHELGSTELAFAPGAVKPGDYTFNIGSAGSTTLVLQTVLLPLLLANGPSRAIIRGGTHNPAAPTFDFIDHTFLPLLGKMGAKVKVRLAQPGFIPAGGGCIEVDIEPATKLTPIKLRQRGKITRRHATVWLASLKDKIAQREMGILQRALGLQSDEFTLKRAENSPGPGNVISVAFESATMTEVFTSHGRCGMLAEAVAEEAAEAALAWLKSGVPVGPHLADQLLLPMILLGGGSFRTGALSTHTRTNIDVIRKFVDTPISAEEESEGVFHVMVG